MCAEFIPLSVLALDLPVPVGGWPGVVEDDLGRPSVPREVARSLLAEHREAEARAARRREEIEQRVIAADEARRAAMPKGIPVSAVPEGMTAAQLMMLADPERQRSRRQSVLEHALEHPAGAVVFTPIREQAGQ